VFETIKREAARYGVNVVESEIIGMVPLQALIDVAMWYLQVNEFDVSRVIEYKVLDIFAKELEEKE